MNEPLFNVGDSVIYHAPPDGYYPITLSLLEIKKAKENDSSMFKITRRAMHSAEYYYILDGMPNYLVQEDFIESTSAKEITNSEFESLLNGV